MRLSSTRYIEQEFTLSQYSSVYFKYISLPNPPLEFLLEKLIFH